MHFLKVLVTGKFFLFLPSFSISILLYSLSSWWTFCHCAGCSARSTIILKRRSPDLAPSSSSDWNKEKKSDAAWKAGSSPHHFYFSHLSFLLSFPPCKSAPTSLIFLIRTWGASFCRPAIIVSAHIGSRGTLQRTRAFADSRAPKKNSLDHSLVPSPWLRGWRQEFRSDESIDLFLCKFRRRKGMPNENSGMRWPERRANEQNARKHARISPTQDRNIPS